MMPKARQHRRFHHTRRSPRHRQLRQAALLMDLDDLLRDRPRGRDMPDQRFSAPSRFASVPQ
jgi:hypothetical protein